MKVIAYTPAELQAVRFPAPRLDPCDFCQTGTLAYRYPARDVTFGTVRYGTTVVTPVSLGAWRACNDCSELIEAGDWPALARRTLQVLNLDLSRAGPGLRVRLLAQAHAAHQSFQRARTGPREAI